MLRACSSSSSSLLLLSLLLLLLSRAAAAADDAECRAEFRASKENFVLDAEDAVSAGAALLATAVVSSTESCQRKCCKDPRCNLALLEPRGGEAAKNRTCVTLNCIHRNRFVCRFVNKEGYQSFILQQVYMKHLRGPKGENAPPIAIAGRDVVTQPGQPVVLNGIESLALGDATIERYHWTQDSGEQDVKMEKTEFPDQVKLSNLLSGSYVFQLTVTDSNDQSQSTKVKVLVLNSEQTSLYCRAPTKVGPCRAAFPRWYYNTSSAECKQFTYGGCKQNNNNYLSRTECLSACAGVVASERSVSIPAAEQCGVTCSFHQLTCANGCCVDRSLECDGKNHCSDGTDEEHCSKLNQTFNRLLNIDVNQRKARCSEPPHTGPCRASFTRWYYSPLERKCNRFTYGGCEANENNFEEEKKCSETCEGVTERSVFFRGMFDRFEKEDEVEEESDSAKIGFSVLLAVGILAVLAGCVYLFLKKRKERALQAQVL